MIKDSESLYMRVVDLLTVPTALDQIAKEYTDVGYEVERGFLGSVVLKLNDGEVHYVPSGRGIDEVIFRYQ